MKHLITCLLLLICLPTFASEREVTLKREFGTLYGTLSTPDKGSEVAVLIIAGSGPTDRNGNSMQTGLHTNCYSSIAGSLEKQGIASLRYDKRGIGKSLYTDPKKMTEVLFDDFAADAAAWVEWLRGEGFRKVVIAGHSEGSLIALCVATGSYSEKSKPAAIISLSGAGFPIDEVLMTQLSAQLATANPGLLDKAQATVNTLRKGQTTESYPRELSMLFLPYLQRFLISEMKYKPQELIAKLKIPVLIVNGDNDLQVSTANAQALKKAQPRAQLLIIEGMTHTLKQSKGRDGMGQMATYTDQTIPLDSTLTAALPKFVSGL